ncbi:hypothetical protein Tco_1561178 [Tanacetum coccineum]
MTTKINYDDCLFLKGIPGPADDRGLALEFAGNASRSNKKTSNSPHFGEIKKLKSCVDEGLWQLETQICVPSIVIVQNTLLKQDENAKVGLKCVKDDSFATKEIATQFRVVKAKATDYSTIVIPAIERKFSVGRLIQWRLRVHCPAIQKIESYLRDQKHAYNYIQHGTVYQVATRFSSGGALLWRRGVLLLMLTNKGWVDGNGSNPSGGFGKPGGGQEIHGGGDRLEGPGGQLSMA